MERCILLFMAVIKLLNQEKKVNKDQMIALLQDGAYFNWVEEKFYHSSFRQGFRKIKTSNISWKAVERFFWDSKRLVRENQIYKLI